eukprot:g7325.t1
MRRRVRSMVNLFKRDHTHVLDYRKEIKEIEHQQYCSPQATLPPYDPDAWNGVHRAHLSTGVVELRTEDGQVMYRAKMWKRKYAVLKPVAPRGAAITFYKSDKTDDPRGSVVLTPDSHVLETGLNPASFVLVTPFVVLHLSAETDKERGEWVLAIQRLIHACSDMPHLPQSVLTAAAGGDDRVVHVRYEAKQPLGFACKQVGQWAVITATQVGGSRELAPGLVLRSINGQNVTLVDYMDVVKQLQRWAPPLALEFSEQPGRSGRLRVAQAGAGVVSGTDTGELRVLRLHNGTLYHFLSSSHAAGEALGDGRDSRDEDRATSVGWGGVDYGEVAWTEAAAGFFQLEGACLRILPPAEVKHRAPFGTHAHGDAYCFQLLSATGSLVLQGASQEDADAWCGTLCHAICVANGGLGHELCFAADERRREAALLMEAAAPHAAAAPPAQPAPASGAHSVEELRALLHAAGVAHGDCTERAELEARMRRVELGAPPSVFACAATAAGGGKSACQMHYDAGEDTAEGSRSSFEGEGRGGVAGGAAPAPEFKPAVMRRSVVSVRKSSTATAGSDAEGGGSGGGGGAGATGLFSGAAEPLVLGLARHSSELVLALDASQCGTAFDAVASGHAYLDARAFALFLRSVAPEHHRSLAAIFARTGGARGDAGVVPLGEGDGAAAPANGGAPSAAAGGGGGDSPLSEDEIAQFKLCNASGDGQVSKAEFVAYCLRNTDKAFSRGVVDFINDAHALM